MKRLILASLIALVSTATAAYAAPKHESPAVQKARAEVSQAKAHLKSALSEQRKGAKIERAKARIRKDQATLAKLEGNADKRTAEDTCRDVASKTGETWEDACERLGIIPDLGCGTCQDNHDGSCTCAP